MKKTKAKKPAKKTKSAAKKKKVSKKPVKKTIRKTLIKHKVKRVSASKKAENLSRLADALIEKGKKRGFITYDEILKTFPDIENNILFLDELYEKFAVIGIDILEGGNLLNLDVDLTDKDLKDRKSVV